MGRNYFPIPKLQRLHRWSSGLMFTMGIPLSVKRHLYIETVPWMLQLVTLAVCHFSTSQNIFALLSTHFGANIKWYLYNHTALSSESTLPYISAYRTCGGTYGNYSGIIISPGYPEDYYDNENCGYLIVAPVVGLLALQTLYFSLGNCCDYVEASNEFYL